MGYFGVMGPSGSHRRSDSTVGPLTIVLFHPRLFGLGDGNSMGSED
jgi:hypothetical protein